MKVDENDAKIKPEKSSIFVENRRLREDEKTAVLPLAFIYEMITLITKE
ncbi:hypothetical protein [Siminovitchia fordii]|uniref:Uncharacterized protein n=1 Tax=Siminovitchia fordii TaxID=254759 RepID=A0ABQ4K1Z2_9BACI|nr:hypothetical protein [Siminovitchia fordii]GIN19765.1 hypothetical protein J1TS3_08990 [Siminovitchia fordii]